MTAQVASSYAATRIKSVFQSADDAATSKLASYERSGELIAKTLGELKGAVMKVGQMASIAGDILPREIADPLRALQRKAPPMEFSVIAEQIERELGSPPELLFTNFDREPFAAASIGQVHRATSDDGREVVVKVQYPGVDDAVDSDLAHLKFVLRASGLVKSNKHALDSLFTEIRTRLHEELDYCNEADNVRLFREYHRERHPFLVIPEVVGERSSGRVLTLTYEPGDHIDELDGQSSNYTQETRDLLGTRLFSVMAAQLFDFQVIHADPNPGNLALRPDGSLVLYDFGCVKRVENDTLRAYCEAIRTGIDEDYPALEYALLELGVRDPRGPPVDFSYYKPWRDAFALPFVHEGIFDYGTSTIHDKVIKLVPGAMRHMASFQPPVELVFIDRMIAGHYGNLRKLRARGRHWPLVESLISSVLDG